MSFHQQVCLYGKLMASQSCSLKAPVWVYVCACLCAFIHIFYVGISTHGFASVCVCLGGWVFVCVLSSIFREKINIFMKQCFFFFFVQYNPPSLFTFHFSFPSLSPNFSLFPPSLSLSFSLSPLSPCVPQFFIPSLIIYHHYSSTTWYDKYQTWVVYRYSICFSSQSLLTEAFSLTWIACWVADFHIIELNLKPLMTTTMVICLQEMALQHQLIVKVLLKQCICKKKKKRRRKKKKYIYIYIWKKKKNN